MTADEDSEMMVPGSLEVLEARDADGVLSAVVERSDPHDLYTYRIRRIVHESRSSLQHIVIAETYNYGRALFLDGNIQSAHADQALYHETLVQPAMLGHSSPQDVLIIGGGEGAALWEVLRHPSVRTVTMVDYDRQVVEACREHLSAWHQGAFDDPRARLVFQDGRQFIEQTAGTYDVVIIDVVDMFDNGPAQALYTRQFYERLCQRLRPGAVVAVQGLEFSFLDDQPHAALARTLRTVFREVSSYNVTIPSFLCSWGFLVASDHFCLGRWSATEIDHRIQERCGPDGLTHVTGEFLRGCFSFCKTTQARLSRPGPILEDGIPFEPIPYE